MELPTGIALDQQDNVYLTDSRNARVVKFTSSGTFIKAWGSYGAGDGQFKVAMGIAVDPRLKAQARTSSRPAGTGAGMGRRSRCSI